MAEYNIKKGPFRFWCQKILPLVYDDSLSYYELLCRVVDYLNKEMEDISTVTSDMQTLQEYVSTYFTSLDVQTEINSKLDKMAEDGTLGNVLSTYVTPILDRYNDEMQNAITSVNTALQTNTTELAELSSRMDTFASLPDGSLSTAADAELVDIRTTFNGDKYADAGTAVRKQASENRNLAKGTLCAELKFTGTNGSATAFNDYRSFPFRLGKVYNIEFDINTFETASGSGTDYYLATANNTDAGTVVDRISSASGFVSSAVKHVVYTFAPTADANMLRLRANMAANSNYDFSVTVYEKDIPKFDEYFGRTKYTISGNIGSTNNHSEFVKIPIKAGAEYWLKLKVNTFTSVASFNDLRLRTAIGADTLNIVQVILPTFVHFFANESEYLFNFKATADANYIEVYTNNATQTDYNYEFTVMQDLNGIGAVVMENEEYKSIASLYKGIRTFTVIGDSLAEGTSAMLGTDNETHWISNDDWSWGKIMASTYNGECTVRARGGYTSHDWRVHTLPTVLEEENRAVYIIGLGVNDINDGVTIGTESDINDVSPNSNPDTYFGNMGCIIQSIRNKAPKSKIIVCNIPRTGNFTNANDALRTIVSHYDKNVYLLDLFSIRGLYLNVNSPVYKNSYRAHYNSSGYALIADIMIEQINKLMNENYVEFKYINYIGTDYEDVIPE